MAIFLHNNKITYAIDKVTSATSTITQIGRKKTRVLFTPSLSSSEASESAGKRWGQTRSADAKLKFYKSFIS